MQKRSHDYRGARSSENLNAHLVALLPPGVYQGLTVLQGGTVKPGTLLTAEGVRIEETTDALTCYGEGWASDGVPPGDDTYTRLDLVVCHHEYQQTIPPTAATFRVIQGTPAETPSYPDLPANCTLVAWAVMEAGQTTWEEVLPAGPPERLDNAQREADWSYTIIKGGKPARREVWDANLGTYNVYIHAATGDADGDPLVWGTAELTLTADGITQLNALSAIFGADHNATTGKHKALTFEASDVLDLLWQKPGTAGITLRGYAHANTGYLWFTLNAAWDSGTSKWIKDVDNARASALRMDVGGMYIMAKSDLDEDPFATFDFSLYVSAVNSAALFYGSFETSGALGDILPSGEGLAAAATAGFGYFASMAAAPTGVPTRGALANSRAAAVVVPSLYRMYVHSTDKIGTGKAWAPIPLYPVSGRWVSASPMVLEGASVNNLLDLIVDWDEPGSGNRGGHEGDPQYFVFTADRAGKFRASATVTFAGDAGAAWAIGETASLHLCKIVESSPVIYARLDRWVAPNVAFHTVCLHGSCLIQLAVGDKLALSVTQNSVTAKETYAGSAFTFLELEEI